MIKTRTRIYEEYLVNLYKNSLKGDYNVTKNITAHEVIFQMKSAFKLITAFDGIEHDKNLDMLYLNCNNVIENQRLALSEKMFVSESTLDRFRCKYAKIIKIILEFNEIEI